jgi:hypothetical protein
VSIMPRDVFEKLRLPLEPTTMCLELGDNSIRNPLGVVDGRLSYQSSYGFASGQIPRRSQGTILPSSVRTQGIEFVEQCVMQGFNLVKQGKLSFEEPSCT